MTPESNVYIEFRLSENKSIRQVPKECQTNGKLHEYTLLALYIVVNRLA